MEFEEFDKIPRFSRECTITEKIDGTNGLIAIGEDGEFQVGSRTRWITPEDDNHGFARWALANKEDLMRLGPGKHYGEWWGSGIQRRYGLANPEKRFSLFNTFRWADESVRPFCCHVVPILFVGLFNQQEIEGCLYGLRVNGSAASPGFMQPEGIIVYHHAAKQYFKKTLDKDEEWKGNIRTNSTLAENK